MTGIATGHRVLNNQTQSIMAMMQDVTAAQTIGGLINLFNYFDPVRPDGTDSTQFTFDTEIITPSNGTGHSISIPFDVRFSVTITDDEKRTAETMMLHAMCDPSAANPDASLPSGVFVAMDDIFYKAQLASLGTNRKHLNDAAVFVNSIIIKA